MADHQLYPTDAPHDWENLPAHELCTIFPEASDEDYKNLMASMQKNGFLDSDPVVLITEDSKTKILDGRNRHLAAIDSGLTPRFVSYEGDDAVGFVLARNLNRRHLTTGQKAALASKLATLKVGDNQFNGGGMSQADAAKATGTSEASVRRFKQLEKASPEKAAEVAAGQVSLEQARQEVLGAEAVSEIPEKLPEAPSQTPRQEDPDAHVKHLREQFSKAMDQFFLKRGKIKAKVNITWSPDTGCNFTEFEAE